MSIKLLLADDSVVIQKLVGLSFANEDIEIITVDNGDDAVTRAASSQPDIVLADVVMPGKNGYEVCSAIRGHAELANTPVLLLTGTFEAFDESRAAEVGATGHITKPFEAQALVDRVNEILASQPGTAAETPAASNSGSDFFDQNTGDLGMEGAAERTDPMSAPPASPEAPTVAQDFVFGESDPLTGAPPAPTPPGDAIDADLGIESHGDPMGGDRTVAFMPDSEEPVAEPWAVSTPTPVPAPPAAPPPATSNPDQTMLIDDFMGDDPALATPAANPATRETDAASGAAIGALDLASMPAQPPLDSIGSLENDDSLDIDGLSFDDSPGMDSMPSLPGSGGDETVIADDLFGDDAPSLGVTAPGIESAPPAAAAPPQPPAPSASQGLDIDFGAPAASDSIVPDNAEDYDVSASDLKVDPMRDDSSWGNGVPSGVQTGPTPITPPHDVAPPPSPQPAASDDVSPGLDADFSAPSIPEAPDFSPQPTPAPPAAQPSFEPAAVAEPVAMPEPDGSDSAAAPAPSAAAPSPAPATASTSSSSELSPDMRDRIHDTLEKVAWEAFSELSDDLVKQLVERVEQIAWEVIPQMAETLIKEEIRKMKAEEGEDA